LRHLPISGASLPFGGPPTRSLKYVGAAGHPCFGLERKVIGDALEMASHVVRMPAGADANVFSEAVVA